MSVALETKLEMKYQSFRADIGTTHALCALFCGARQTPACYIVIICSKNMHKCQQDHLEKTLKERPRPLIRKYNDRFNGIKGYKCATRKARVIFGTLKMAKMITLFCCKMLKYCSFWSGHFYSGKEMSYLRCELTLHFILICCEMYIVVINLRNIWYVVAFGTT